MNRILCLLPLMLALCACSVKEDRSVCPCELFIRPVEPLKTEGNVLVSVIQDGSVVKQGMLTREDFESGKYSVIVPRKKSTVTVFTGITDMNTVGGRLLSIRYSHQCDEVYSCSEAAALADDEYECIVLPHKNFALLRLIVLGMPEGGEVKVKGTVQGYDLVSLDPSGGSFDCEPQQGVGSWSLRLPRQTDESLLLEVSSGGVPVYEVPLGSLIAASGYNFADEDLSDMTITVDLTRKDAVIEVAGWELSESYVVEF